MEIISLIYIDNFYPSFVSGKNGLDADVQLVNCISIRSVDIF